jgi:hypothetical protein
LYNKKSLSGWRMDFCGSPSDFLGLMGMSRDNPAHLAVRGKSDWQSDLLLAVRGKSDWQSNLLLAVHHGKSQRAIFLSKR